MGGNTGDPAYLRIFRSGGTGELGVEGGDKAMFLTVVCHGLPWTCEPNKGTYACFKITFRN
jgi:hypothetical protein